MSARSEGPTGIAPRAAARVVTLVALAATSFARPVGAQDMPLTAWGHAPDASASLAGTATAWLGAWSPLRAIGDLPRGLLRAPLAPGLLDAPPPPAGAFVLAGAPGALAFDLRQAGDSGRFGELRARVASESGDFHRPFDFGESQVRQLVGQGWAPVGRRGVAIGRFVLDREASDVSATTGRVAPYGSSPFVIADSVTPPMQRTRARLEGALGWRLGGWGVGGAVALDTREQNTVDFPLRRTGRGVLPAVTLGAERALPWLGLRVGGFWRWMEPKETNILSARPAATQVYPVQGLDEPQSLRIESGSGVFTHIERHATAPGGSLQLDVFGVRAVVTHERSTRAEDQFSPGGAQRSAERWRAEGHVTRAQLTRAVGSRVRAMLVASNEQVEGTATRPDLTGTIYGGTDVARAVEADVRVALGGAWSAAVVGGATSTERTGTDFVAALTSTLDVTTPFVSAELARRGPRLSVALGASGASAVPTGDVPLVEQRGPYYQRFIAPALAYEAADTRAFAGWLTVTGRVRGAMILGSVRAERASPATLAAQRLQPGGERTGWSVVLGVRP